MWRGKLCGLETVKLDGRRRSRTDAYHSCVFVVKSGSLLEIWQQWEDRRKRGKFENVKLSYEFNAKTCQCVEQIHKMIFVPVVLFAIGDRIEGLYKRGKAGHI